MSALFPKTISIFALAVCFFGSSCQDINVFEKNAPVAGHQWTRQHAISGNFELTDTAAIYNIYLVLRHTDAYEYNNIWLDIGLQSPGDSMQFQKIDVSLGSDANGWEGTGMNDIWEVRKKLKVHRFQKPGAYQYNIRHAMRDNPLPHVMSVGLRVEKAM